MSVFLVVSTAPEREAPRIARRVIEDRLAACVNIIRGVSSVFYWQGKLCQEKEALIWIKASTRRLRKLINKIKEIHSYELPEIIYFRVDGGEKKYLKWVNEMGRGKRR